MMTDERERERERVGNNALGLVWVKCKNTRMKMGVGTRGRRKDVVGLGIRPPNLS